jgi:hypothetical protein
MGPFIAITALWGYPYLVGAQDVAPTLARTWLMICVIAFAVSAPLLGAVVARAPWMRTGLLLGTTLAVTAAWAATLLWPGGHPPAAVLLATLVITGAGGACAMLAFDVARGGNPAHSAGGATGLANTGGFSAAVGVQLAAAGLLHLGAASIQVALLPMLGLLALACVQGVRFALSGPGAAEGSSPPAPNRMATATPGSTRA